MDKKSIIFVDDEQRILEGLRRMLRSMRQEWHMEFVTGGQEALDALAHHSFDVIVSDMRMPGMDGAQLLNRVKQMYPQVARIALSGQTSKETILQSVGPIHQYLPKPCDAESLKATVNRVCALRNVLTNEKIRGLTSQLESLPCLSGLYSDLMEALGTPDVTIRTVGNIIRQDVAMSAKILQLVNSAFFGVQRHVGCVEQAVMLLGLELIKALVLSVRIFSQFDKTKLGRFNQEALWRHSMTTASFAKLIAEDLQCSDKQRDYMLLAGMLHDVGQLVLATTQGEDYEAVLKRLETDAVNTYQAEQEILGATHAEVGAYLLGLWGFSDSIINAVAYHHLPQRAHEKDPVIAGVYLANLFAVEVQPSRRQQKPLQPDMTFLNEQGLSERVDALRGVCHRSAETVSAGGE
ncbi:MAG: HDOD domain-containing protein [Sedimentisphaerales bacterium]|nr:HDOD domain-containing protein [Sedimentisphaerales bacterium]